MVVRNFNCCLFLMFSLLMAGLSVQPIFAQNTPQPAASGVTVLDELSSWRMIHLLRTPAIDAGGKLVDHKAGVSWLDEHPLDGPPKGWQQMDFDDSAWLRTTASGSCRTPYLARQCIRGKFQVSNPAAVKNLTVSLEYHGGAIVYLNGQEIARANLPAGNVGPNTVAEAYPLEAFVKSSGDLLAVPGSYIDGGKAGALDAESRQRMDGRLRKMENVKLPANLLKKGVNILAIELVRAPYHKVMLETSQEAGGKNRRNKFDWGTCQFAGVKLQASSPDGLLIEPHRPQGFQIFNSDIMESMGTFAFGDAAEPLRPIRIVGARSGVFSGRVVVGSTEPIRGLSAKAGALRNAAGAVIPESAVTVRYGSRWGFEVGFSGGEGLIVPPYPQSLHLLGALDENPPAEVPVEGTKTQIAPGASMPVYVTVQVAANTPAGTYKGPLTISAEGLPPVKAEVELQVVDCLLPGSQNQRTWVELIQVPEVLSMEYETELWSDKHFELIAQSLRLIRDSGTRIVYIPAIAHTNLGSKESMIRWIPKADGSYEWDFSIMERYLDLVKKELGDPKVVVLQLWEIYMIDKGAAGRRFEPGFEERHAETGGRPLVTKVDRATGKTENVPVAGPTQAGAAAVWKPLIAEVSKRLKARGLDGRLMLGMFTDITPPREHMVFYQQIAPDLPWVQQGHGRWTKKVHDIAEVGYQATVWGGFRFADGLKQTNQKGDPIVASLYGWKNPRLDVIFERNNGLDNYSTSRWRYFPESAITGELRGFGRVGADYWRVIKDRRDKRTGFAHERYSAGDWSTSWINLNLATSTLAPGPKGPLMTTRLLAMIEGVQESEARIIIEQALSDDALKRRLGPELAKRCQTALDRRLVDMWRTMSNLQLGGQLFFGAGAWRWAPNTAGHRWYLGTDWQSQSAELFELAGTVQKKLGR